MVGWSSDVVSHLGGGYSPDPDELPCLGQRMDEEDALQDPGRTVVDDAQTVRVSMEEAARLLRIEKGSVKKRIQRGKLRSEKDAKGRIWVYLNGSETVHDESGDKSETVWDGQLEDLREQIRYLREQLDREREARTEERRRQDTIIAQLSAATAEQARTIQQLEAPEQPWSTQASAEDSPSAGEMRVDPTTPSEPSGGPQEGSQAPQERRSWWREFFGFG
jgi:chromosome segregation ATPase